MSWFIDGIRCKCPHCHEGDLFKGVLKLNEACPKCGKSFKDAETADGPAFFVMTLVGLILTPVIFILIMGFKMSPRMVMVIITPLTIALCIWLLRPFKAGIYALQVQKKFKEAKAKDYINFK